jgi:hypothetical protein
VVVEVNVQQALEQQVQVAEVLVEHKVTQDQTQLPILVVQVAVEVEPQDQEHPLQITQVVTVDQVS